MSARSTSSAEARTIALPFDARRAPSARCEACGGWCDPYTRACAKCDRAAATTTDASRAAVATVSEASPAAKAPGRFAKYATLLDGRAPCGWCGGSMKGKRPHARWCKKSCKQTASRLHTRNVVPPAAATLPARAIRVAYADPPYPGTAKKIYGREPSYAGEVDHAALVARLVAEFPDGWALSTSEEALFDVLALCKAHGARVHVCPWVKPKGVSRKTYGLHNAWEALIVCGGRGERPGVRDFLYTPPARGGGTLRGRKPLAFCAFLFRALGMHAGDELVDLFPGTGIVLRAWRESSRRESVAASGSVASSSSDASGARKRRPSTSRRIAARRPR